MGKKNKIHVEQSEAGIFFEKIYNKALKFIVELLNCTLGPSNLGVKGVFLTKKCQEVHER